MIFDLTPLRQCDIVIKMNQMLYHHFWNLLHIIFRDIHWQIEKYNFVFGEGRLHIGLSMKRNWTHNPYTIRISSTAVITSIPTIFTCKINNRKWGKYANFRSKRVNHATLTIWMHHLAHSVSKQFIDWWRQMNGYELKPLQALKVICIVAIYFICTKLINYYAD